MPLPRAGDEFLLDQTVSPQFRSRPLAFRVIRVEPATTNDDMIWLDGYELDPVGEAVERRSVLVTLVALPARALRSPAGRR